MYIRTHKLKGSIPKCHRSVKLEGLFLLWASLHCLPWLKGYLYFKDSPLVASFLCHHTFLSFITLPENTFPHTTSSATCSVFLLFSPRIGRTHPCGVTLSSQHHCSHSSLRPHVGHRLHSASPFPSPLASSSSHLRSPLPWHAPPSPASWVSECPPPRSCPSSLGHIWTSLPSLSASLIILWVLIPLGA